VVAVSNAFRMVVLLPLSRRSGLAWASALFVCLACLPAVGLTAVAELNEEPWYTTKRLAGNLGACTLATGYAPHPVLVEGHASTPRDEIVSYSWDWGDGSDDTAGFVAAHVYETPGEYTITLTVTDEASATDQDTLAVEVLEPTGYRYVSGSGSDSNDGTAPETAWRSATKAATVAGTVGALPAGTRVVFADDSTYDLYPGVWTSVRSVGITFARSGDGDARPIIRRVVNPSAPQNANKELIKVASIDLLHVAFWGLEFDGLSEDKQGFGTIFALVGRGCSVLFHECRLVNGYQLAGAQKWTEPNVATNFYVSSCTGGNAGAYESDSGYYGGGSTLFYAKVRRWAFINNEVDYSNNHILYADWGQGAVVKGNQFRYPAFGRHCLRVSGGWDMTIPTQNVWVGSNVFTGWVDPIQTGGAHNAAGFERYNHAPLVIAPNTTTPQSIEYVDVVGNTVTDGERFINIAAASHVRVSGNTFTTSAPYQSAPRIEFGDSKERRPLYDVIVEDNTLTTGETRASGKGILVQLHAYAGSGWQGLDKHTGLVVRDNAWTVTGAVPWAFHIPDDGAQQAQLVHANDWTGINRDTDDTVMVGGVWNAPGTQYTLAEWYASTGNEPASGTAPELPPAEPPAAVSKRIGVRR
jgi:PKD repeat protein